MRQLKFALRVAAALTILAAQTVGAQSTVDVGQVNFLLGSTSPGDVNAAGADARLFGPNECLYDSSGNMYVVHESGKIKVVASGSNTPADFATGLGSALKGLTQDAAGTTLYVTDQVPNPFVQQTNVKSLSVAAPATTVTTLVTDSTWLFGIAYVNSEQALVAADLNRNALRKMPAVASAAPADVVPSSSGLMYPRAVAVNQNTDVIYAGTNHHDVWSANVDGSNAQRIAGQADVYGYVDGTTAKFDRIEGVAVSAGGNYLFVADFFNNAVRRIDLADYSVTTVTNRDREVSVLAGNAVSYLATTPRPFGVCFNGDYSRMAITTRHAVLTVGYDHANPPPAPTPQASTLAPGTAQAVRALMTFAGAEWGSLIAGDVDGLKQAIRADLSMLFGVTTTEIIILNLFEGSLVVDVVVATDSGVPSSNLVDQLNAAAADPTMLTNTAALYGTVSSSGISSLSVAIDEETAAPGAVTPACSCGSEKLSALYTSDAIPDATAEAEVNISLDTNTWEVVFQIRNVKAISNGHVIASVVNTQEVAAAAFTPFVGAFSTAALWQPPACGLGGIDTPASNLKVAATWDHAACRTSYEMRYSLVDAAARDEQHCDLTDDNAGNINVNCSIVLSSVRAFDGTDPEAFLAQEAAFAAEINLGSRLNNEVENLLHATLAKCSVKNGQLYVVDCRVPGTWDFLPTFQIVQEPANWIDASSCAATQTASATFIRCNIENDAPIANVEVARANLTATPDAATTNAMTFDIEFIVPRKITTFASASLASFIQNIAMADGKFFYGTADKATLHIDVFDSSRLTMTALELFNSATPSKEVMDLFPGTSDARFQTAINANPTRFIIEFYPAAIRENSRFYRFGPHGINISFTFAAARRTEEGGYAVVDGLNVEGSEEDESNAAGAAFTTGSAGAVGAAVAVAAVVVAVGLIGAAVAVQRRTNKAEQQTTSAVEL